MDEAGPDAGLILYFRDYCHLCEQLASMLKQGWPDHFARIEFRNVDVRQDWAELYGLRVPVLLENGDLISELLPDREQLQQHFGEPANPL